MAYRISYKYLGQNLQSETVTKDWIKTFLRAGTGPANKTFVRSWSPEEALSSSWGYNSNSNSESENNGNSRRRRAIARDRNIESRSFVAPLESILIKHVTETGNLRAPAFSASRRDLSLGSSPDVWKNVAWEWMASNFPGRDRFITGEVSGEELYNKFNEFFSTIPEPDNAAIAAAAERRAAEAARRAAAAPAPAPVSEPSFSINNLGGGGRRRRASRRASRRSKRNTRRH